MTAAASPRNSARPWGVLRRWRQDRQGAVAIEFAIVAIPFFAIIFAIIETAVVFFAGQALDEAVNDQARLIRTGQIQQDATSQEDFRALVCDALGPMFDCGPALMVDVQTFSSFGSIDLDVPVVEDEDELFEDMGLYSPGGAGAIVVVRAYYAWPVIFDFFGFDLANLPGGRHLLSSVAAFRNEPFPWDNPFEVE